MSPTFGVGLLDVLAIDRSDCATGDGVLVDVLFPGVGSVSLLAVIVAVFP